MIARLFARTRFTWRLYDRFASSRRKQRRWAVENPPTYPGDVMAGDHYPDGAGWAWRGDRCRWVNVYTGKEGPVFHFPPRA